MALGWGVGGVVLTCTLAWPGSGAVKQVNVAANASPGTGTVASYGTKKWYGSTPVYKLIVGPEVARYVYPQSNAQ
ncbi:predicted protein [Plenodomus lingam JN3]|uniref:Predicted protein n=1 Tax=Leptosphaeria maculans (strain JN3 / isolate v23.1.3 / race Av1-4-5-6-7-8) TaxID=985895 RepID=E5ADQ9_LEPMJ|nr:predicted protein [Plenodomus lingam JN3]CBY01348.1 predicted protein [Plenodomus lingam JN3]